MPRNVFIVLFTYIIVSNHRIQLQISNIKHYVTDVFTLFYTSLWEDSHQDEARAKCLSYGNNNNNNKCKLKIILRKAGDSNPPSLVC
jgi:hypothetical protein